MAAHYGALQEFHPEAEELSVYLERVELFFIANETSDEKKVPILLNVMGATTYGVLRSLLAPANPKEKSMAEIVAALKGHYEPKRNVVAERFQFHRRNQNQGESVTEFVAELRRIAARCAFGNYLDQALRDRVVCGLKSEAIQKRLLTEGDVTLAKAIEIALSMETAQRDAQAFQPSLPGLAVGELSKRTKNPNALSSPCYRCGRAGHVARECGCRSAICHKCGKLGHLARVCRGGARFRQRGSGTYGEQTNAICSDMTADPSPDLTPGEDVINTINSVDSHNTHPYRVTLELNGTPVEMEIDTGAAVSIISETTKKALFPRVKLSVSPIVLRTYSSEPLTVLGQFMVQVCYKGYTGTHTLTVVQGEGSSLMGRDWLKAIRIDWASIKAVSVERPMALNNLLSEYSSVFDPGTGAMKHVKAHLCLKEGSLPKFCRPRTVPYAIRDQVGKELDRLENAGVLCRVDHADWATPIVPVPKKDGSIRICGDFKVTINPSLRIDQYPLPKPSDLMTSLTGGQKFSKLDLSAAYQQIVLDDEASELVVINTHQGLYKYTRLPFGIASAPAIFQKAMDGILQGIPHCICYLDDILVTGRSDEEHLQNLRRVLHRLWEHGVKLHRDKCTFFQNTVEYLGHTISAEGVHTTSKKLKAIVDAPSPSNVSELRSFLGLLNYYGKFLPSLAATLHPLHTLLRTGQPWKWSPQCAQAFEKAKRALIEAPILVHYNPDLPISLAGDASAYGVGAVISHSMPDGTERPVAFTSRTLSMSEKNYSQVEKEALSLIFGIKKFHQYLFGRHFTLITDHKPLTTILGPKQGVPQVAAARMQRWALLLSAYSYSIKFRPTQEHCNADGLSRLPIPATTAIGSPEDPTIFNMRQISSLPVQASDIARATRSDPVLSKVVMFLKQGWPVEVSDELKPFSCRRHELTMEGDVLLWGMRVVIPFRLREQVLQELHHGHQGIVRMKALARSYVWWPQIDREMEERVKGCSACQEVKNAPPKAPLNPWPWPQTPWDRIHADFAGPIQNKMLLVLVDSHSKWPEVCILTKTTANITIATLREIFARNGIPREFVSDNGPQFVSQEFHQFMTENGIRHIRTSPYHPASNGAAERFVQTVKKALSAGLKEGVPLEKTLATFLLQYRNTPHPTTGVAPSSLLLQRTLRTRLDLLRPDVGAKVRVQQGQQKDHHDQHTRTRTFPVGHPVWVRNFRGGASWVEGVIEDSLGPVSYLVCVQGGALWKRHVDHVRDRLDRGQEDQTGITTSSANTGVEPFPSTILERMTRACHLEIRRCQG